jgi:hypothetical protein
LLLPLSPLVGVWKYNGYTGSRVGPARGLVVGTEEVKRERDGGRQRHRQGRPTATNREIEYRYQYNSKY